MFQPQPTPYSPFTSYGAPTEPQQDHNAYNYQASGLGLVSSGGPIVFDNPVFSPAAGFRPLSINLNPGRFAAMETPPSDDVAAQEVLARAYQPELKGPLVGDKKSSLAITEEYAKADQTYIIKTSTLPQTYSHYRPVRGDGNCGWRAVGYSYFEMLLKLSDKKLLQAEFERMNSFTQFVASMCGHETWIFEDMRDECLTLLQDIEAVISQGQPADLSPLVLQRFNDAEVSDGIVYWLRLLASAWLKAHPSQFQDFIPDLCGVDAYCRDSLEPTNTEIDHLGMVLLIDVLVKPIGISVEIGYLDRSEGTHVNTHLFESEVPRAGKPTIHLLYRPGHYDILYKELNIPRPRSLTKQQILESAAANSNIQVNRATNFTRRHSIQPTPGSYSDLDVQLLVSMPTIFNPPAAGHSFSEPFSPQAEFSPTSTRAPTYSIDSATAAQSISPVSSVSPTPTLYHPVTSTLPIHSSHQQSIAHASDISPAASRQLPTACQIRPSRYELQEDWGDAPAQGFQTSTFKNSHYNTSHYNNPNFQPEQWTPDCEEAIGKLTRHRTS